ncbi:DUF1796 family putative cysteine peptidase [Erwinia piriflorinigrans]|uniref:Papain-like cysteine peptidase n=1 Tax=Erwinia piriflorinigrans CFBP 5888 TaxID=1161919 RepID=V5Z8A2_9GAMM|nr:DUF1796 family putative cysteine peptidase [Erwinia piriflorinigrans]CCG87464.1 hypothetical protein EPIR_2099 [Erwinia piriflorinigrans CFBP 5888]
MNSSYERFESLGDNCEFSFFLRDQGIDNGSLFKWTLIKNYNSLLNLVKNDFKNLYQLENLEPSWSDMVLDKENDICFHTEMFSDQVNGEWTWRYSSDKNKEIHNNETQKINYLIEKIRKSIVNEEKIFVVKRNDNTIDTEVLELSEYLSTIGACKILYVKSSNTDSQLGNIEKHSDNLYVSYITRFADYSTADNYSKEGWELIINNALEVM